MTKQFGAILPQLIISTPRLYFDLMDILLGLDISPLHMVIMAKELINPTNHMPTQELRALGRRRRLNDGLLMMLRAVSSWRSLLAHFFVSYKRRIAEPSSKGNRLMEK